MQSTHLVFVSWLAFGLMACGSSSSGAPDAAATAGGAGGSSPVSVGGQSNGGATAGGSGGSDGGSSSVGGGASNDFAEKVAAAIDPSGVAACKACIEDPAMDTGGALAACDAELLCGGGTVHCIESDVTGTGEPAGCSAQGCIGLSTMASPLFAFITAKCSTACNNFAIPSDPTSDPKCTESYGDATGAAFVTAIANSVAPSSAASCATCVGDSTKDTGGVVGKCNVDAGCVAAVSCVATESASASVPPKCAVKACIGTDDASNNLFTFVASSCSSECGNFSIPDDLTGDPMCPGSGGLASIASEAVSGWERGVDGASRSAVVVDNAYAWPRTNGSLATRRRRQLPGGIERMEAPRCVDADASERW